MDATDSPDTFVRLEQLEFMSCAGVPDTERRRPQRLLADVTVCFDGESAALSDDLNNSIDYAELALLIRKEGAAASARLLERLVATLCDAVLSRFPAARQVSIRLSKPAIIPRCGAAVVEGRRVRGQ